MRLLVLVALCFAAVTAVPSNSQRIVGGSVTTIDQYPAAVSLLFSSDLQHWWQACAGSILNNRAILTAAHCLIRDPPDRWRTRVGSSFASSGGTVVAASEIINHSGFNARTYDNDISIIRLASNLVYNNYVRAAFIAGSNYNLADNEVVYAIGWGRISWDGPGSEQLRHVQIWTVNQAVCNRRYFFTITANMLCSGWLEVGGRDQCQGDSGGGLYHHNVVVGICSFGRGCGNPRFPGVNTRVSRYTDWIQNNA